MTVQTYDPKEISVSVNGLLITGFAEEFLRAERENAQIDDLSGAQGDVTRVHTNDKRGTVIITLLSTSPSNLVLSDLVNSDGIDGAQSIFSLLVKDNRGDDKIQAEDAWVTQPAAIVYNKGVEGREWTIRAAKLEITPGGIPDTA